ncbi:MULTISPECIES: zinc-dependent alcohol dehydrogenase family protein [unclassified Mesorhizobium]|uniref:zinc-dependent alcohol dehydrogenase family protein n=1 Tax=unclassified Mesorhizobium TaxID=325217 RepID=UPI0011266738|nr:MULTISPECIES: zinc-dependent alcohol dehydrogenase family protein [unclassified Mesorhizobium]MBZ9961574.1 zinc-dependent alcohol dehydrogenase family protein [Mesorhizobium sp. BR1-1-14]MCA0058788.1 zinc-dependent alcohol dehydrogenase family protein [Mesorhizobium sp. B261B1A]TPK54246.1 zinc-dependent alcohol dehydrogenase family protein [Mesorhizobium sp. B2-5-2]TPL03187.1 zinc-dependent alcohol dehydrogenase family protein [Mesorhizobium sp. B2-4-11]TPL25413.1 zinc-dependent alcohol deh
MKAVRLEAVGSITLREVAKPVPGPDDLLVRIESCGVCGTDRHLFHGEFPCRPPVTPGHEFSGIVEAMGHSVSGFSLGDRVTGDPNIACGRCRHCHAGRINLCSNLNAIGIHRDGGFADYVVLPQKQAFILPADLKPTHGAFCEPLGCCLHGVDLAEIKPGSSVAILGGGVIGLLTVQLARLAGATTIILSTRQASRRALAEELGATATVDASAADVIDAISGPAGLVPGGVDVVLECAGVQKTVEQSLRLARAGGTVVIVGVVPQGMKAAFEPFDLLFRELKVLGSFLNPYTHRRAAELIASGAIEIDRLISRQVPLEEAAAVIANPPAAGEVKVVVVPDRG